MTAELIRPGPLPAWFAILSSILLIRRSFMPASNLELMAVRVFTNLLMAVRPGPTSLLLLIPAQQQPHGIFGSPLRRRIRIGSTSFLALALQHLLKCSWK